MEILMHFCERSALHSIPAADCRRRLSLIDYEVDIYAGRIFCMQRERRYTHDEMSLRR